ncbi:MAG: cupin-like domain-containing protein [Candidatus Dormibacteria bacterium]
MTALSPPAALDIEPASATALLGGQATTFCHRLEGHPLLTLDALAGTARRLPPSWVNCYGGGDRTPGSYPTPSEVLGGLERGGPSVRLFHLEHVPGFRALLGSVIADLDSTVGFPGRSPGDGVAFVSPPGMTGPMHCDHHHNLLLQVQGTKEVTLGYFDDPSVAQRQVERSLGERQGQLPPTSRTTRVLLRPGDGVYIPPFTFHAVSVLDDISVALSCAVSTPETRRDVLVHSLNHHLRGWRLPATAPGRSPALDRVKTAAVRVSRRTRSRSR